MRSFASSPKLFPAWARIAALLWLGLWVWIYWRAWGPLNFLHLCDLAVILACLGLTTNNALLISSQAVSSLVIDGLWTLDVVWRLATRHHLFGGTEYIFNSAYPAWLRLLTFFHVVLPFLLLWALRRNGYDRRAFRLQTIIAFCAIVAARWGGPTANINFAFRDPFLHRALGPAPVHIAVTFLALTFLVYLPTHFLLWKLFRPPLRKKRERPRPAVPEPELHALGDKR